MAKEYLNLSGLTHLVGKILTKLNSKVDAVSGKGLSTNDFTTAEKEKLAGITAGANKYSLPVANPNNLGGIKAGGDISISTAGIVTVNDNSHGHTIENVNGLQSALNEKAPTTHSHNDLYYQKSEFNDISFVTVDDIDTICGQAIQVASASEVTF